MPSHGFVHRQLAGPFNLTLDRWLRVHVDNRTGPSVELSGMDWIAQKQNLDAMIPPAYFACFLAQPSADRTPGHQGTLNAAGSVCFDWSHVHNHVSSCGVSIFQVRKGSVSQSASERTQQLLRKQRRKPYKEHRGFNHARFSIFCASVTTARPDARNRGIRPGDPSAVTSMEVSKQWQWSAY